jgi:hypothetical protein
MQSSGNRYSCERQKAIHNIDIKSTNKRPATADL